MFKPKQPFSAKKFLVQGLFALFAASMVFTAMHQNKANGSQGADTSIHSVNMYCPAPVYSMCVWDQDKVRTYRDKDDNLVVIGYVSKGVLPTTTRIEVIK